MDEERKQVERGMQPLLTMDGMLFLAPGGMSTRRSGLRLFMPRFMGGGDLVCMFLFMPPGETSRPGELRWFPYPFPKREHGEKGRETFNTPVFSFGISRKAHLHVIKPVSKV